jgi:hypothetical protein
MAYQTEGGRVIAKRRHLPTPERPDHPLKDDTVELDGSPWRVKEIRLFHNTGSPIAVVVEARDA